MKNSHLCNPQINHVNRTINISAAYQRAAAEFGTDAFCALMDIREKCPGYKVVCNTHRKPAKKKANLTYSRMGQYISCLRGGQGYLEIFGKVKEFAKSQPNPYLTVSHWFHSCFPDYGCMPDFDKDGYPIVEVNIVSFEDFKSAREAVAERKQGNSEQLSASSQREQTEVKQEQAS